MKTASTFLNVVSIAAFAMALVTAVISLSQLEGEKGMVPVSMLLTLSFWSLPALTVAVVAFVASMVITTREAAMPTNETRPSGLTHTLGKIIVLFGVFFVAWSMTMRIKGISEAIGYLGTPDLIMVVLAVISILAAAVPGLLVCVFGYWMMQPSKAAGPGRGTLTTA